MRMRYSNGFIRVALAAALGLVLPACGGSGGGGGGPTQPTGPNQSTITVLVTAPTVSLSPRAGFNYRLVAPVTLTESAGLGANINYIRMQFVAAGFELERQEISSADVIALTGTNRLNASSTRNFNLIFDFNAGNATSAVLTVNLTDDHGNNLAATFTITF